MKVKLLPASTGQYRIIKKEELTIEQLAVLRAASREHVEARLRVLVGEGRVMVSQVVLRYRDLMNEVEHDQVAGNLDE
jgi:hypothetical protein